MACGRCRPMRCTASRKVRSRRGRRFRTRTRSARSRRSARASSATLSCRAPRATRRVVRCWRNGIGSADHDSAWRCRMDDATVSTVRGGAARDALRLGRDVCGRSRCARRARPRQPHGAHGTLEHSLRAASACGRRLRTLIYNKEIPSMKLRHLSACRRHGMSLRRRDRRERPVRSAAERHQRQIARTITVRAAQGHRRAGEAAVRHLRAQQQ